MILYVGPGHALKTTTEVKRAAFIKHRNKIVTIYYG